MVVLLHGGHWRTGFGKLVMRPLALDLVSRDVAVLNLEYRRLGSGRGGGGGWPMTFADVANGIDTLAAVAALDLSRVTVVGHSAGGHLALWAASRSERATEEVGAAPVVRASAVVALAPVTHLRRAGAAARELLGGSADDVPDRWTLADPMALLPPPVPVLVVHPRADSTIDVARSRDYVDAAVAAGGDVQLIAPERETHRDPIDPTSASWSAARSWLLAR